MTRSLTILRSLLCLAFVCSLASLSAQETDLPKTCVPDGSHYEDDWWKERHDANKARIAEEDVDLLLIGDSITHHWDTAGEKVRDYYYGDRNCVNMGFGGDQTQQVLWRLEDAPMDKIHPKAVMLLIGINNLWLAYGYDPDDVALGVKAIVDKLQSLYPDIQILLLLTFVTGEGGNDVVRPRVAQSNAKVIDLLQDYPNVTIKDINYLWLNATNGVRPELMNDFVHPTEEGYKVWGAAVEPEISRMLGDAAKPPME